MSEELNTLFLNVAFVRVCLTELFVRLPLDVQILNFRAKHFVKYNSFNLWKNLINLSAYSCHILSATGIKTILKTRAG